MTNRPASESTPSNNRVLQLKNLSKTFKNEVFKKKRPALTNLSCGFEPGKCTALLGHNGAGKTTTIRLILGILFPDSGEILFEGKPLNTRSRAKIGYMPEVNKQAHNLTPLEVLKSHSSLFLRKQNKKEIQQLIERKLKEVKLWEHRHKKIKQLSKGMARRVAWLQASIHQPELLILDEPFSGLDPLGRQEMQAWIEQEKKRHVSIILCTHELWSVNILCDDIHILNNGNLVYSSQDVEVTDRPEPDSGYILHVSGTSQETLQEMASSLSLKPWQGLEQEGWSSKLMFDEYQDACQWLSACIKRGFLIINFTSDGKRSESFLLQFFEGRTN
ncbi:MAG: ABC transporter ATP-binding protein [Bdellovibrionota bacterium]